VVTLNNAQTQVNINRAARRFQQGHARRAEGTAQLLHHPCADLGRISMASVKVGNIVRQADTTPLATINQVAPIYVSFTVPQRNLPDVRAAIAAETASLERRSRQRERGNRPGHDGREHRRSRHRHGHHPRHHAERKEVCGRALWSTPR
jgi:multidrug efflux pump subunit AcrA (membrane-fusion protein)